jgi:outer membrane protein insertion porin family
MSLTGDEPLRVRALRIAGASRTRASVIEAELQDAYAAETFEGVVLALHGAVSRLQNTGVFRSVTIDMAGSPDASERDVTDLVVTVEEKGLFGGQANVHANSIEATADSTVTLHNPLGSAETLAVSGGAGTKSSYSSSARLRRPRFLGLPAHLEVALERTRASCADTSSYDKKEKRFGVCVMDDAGAHRLDWTLAFRDLVPLRDESTPYATLASRPVLYDCSQPSLKNSLAYEFTRDARDDKTSPTRGSLFNVRAETAGMAGGNAYFHSLLVKAQHVVPVGPRLLFGLPGANIALGAKIGAIQPWGVDADRATAQQITGVRICDRFQLGGPLSFRGFKANGVGPRAPPVANNGANPGGDALGAEGLAVMSLRVDVPAPFPILADFGMRAHLFLNAGNLLPLRYMFSNDFRKTMRASAGVGLAFGTGFGRVEMNYTLWHRSEAYDQCVPGFQWGLGADFL